MCKGILSKRYLRNNLSQKIIYTHDSADQGVLGGNSLQSLWEDFHLKYGQYSL